MTTDRSFDLVYQLDRIERWAEAELNRLGWPTDPRKPITRAKYDCLRKKADAILEARARASNLRATWRTDPPDTAAIKAILLGQALQKADYKALERAHKSVGGKERLRILQKQKQDRLPEVVSTYESIEKKSDLKPLGIAKLVVRRLGQKPKDPIRITPKTVLNYVQESRQK